MTERLDSSSKPRGERKVREGLVVSDKMDKTIVVSLEDRVKHPLYGKVIRRTSKVKAHDEANTAGVGDRVRLMETRPLSATKRWRLVEVVQRIGDRGLPGDIVSEEAATTEAIHAAAHPGRTHGGGPVSVCAKRTTFVRFRMMPSIVRSVPQKRVFGRARRALLERRTSGTTPPRTSSARNSRVNLAENTPSCPRTR